MEVRTAESILGDMSTAEGLFSLCSVIARGDLPLEIAKLLSASKLVALPTPNGDMRPVAVGECLRRLAARAICHQNKVAFMDYFCPIQHGVSTPCGIELIGHHIS